MATSYAEEYSPEALQKYTQTYAASMEPQYLRSQQQLANTLAGYSGSPVSNKFQLLQGQRESDIGKQLSGLMATGMEKGYQERTQLAPQYTGMYNGQQTLQGRQTEEAIKSSQLANQYFPSQYTGQLPGGGDTFQYQQWAQMSPYQQAQVSATNAQANLEQYKALYQALAAMPAVSGFLGTAFG